MGTLLPKYPQTWVGITRVSERALWLCAGCGVINSIVTELKLFDVGECSALRLGGGRLVSGGQSLVAGIGLVITTPVHTTWK